MTAPPRRTHARAGLSVVVALAFCGAALGAAWAWIAPPIQTIVGLTKSGERVDAFLGKSADNQFVAMAIMVGLVTLLAIVSAVAVWQWRAHRGPVLAAALWIGQVVAAAAAAGTGAALVHWRYGTPDRNVELSPENRVAYFTEAPAVLPGQHPLQIAVALLLPAAVAALTYAFLAVANPRDDLGGWPPAADRYLPLPQSWPGSTPSAGPVTADGTEPAHRP
jgi:hypothetical protein